MFLQKSIHDWSKTLPDWQRDLLRRLAAGPVSDDDRAEVTAILTGAKGAPAAVPLELADLPLDETERGRVELRRIGQLKNINGLAEEETLKLKPGLNVVFGKNASGKTGHGRLLRSVCRAAERDDILPNVFEPGSASKPQTAQITIEVDGKELTIPLDLAQPPDRALSAISVFDASCARVYLTKPNVITYVPRPLMLLKSLADEQDVIASTLRTEAHELRCNLPQLPVLDVETKAGAALAGLNATSDLTKIEQLATLNEGESAELEALEIAAAASRADTSGELEAAARSRASGARTVVQRLRDAEVLVNEDAISALTNVRKELEAVTIAERELADRAFADQRFPGTGQEPWQEMWAAAKRFAEAGGGEFPSEVDPACPVCQQDLSPEAQTRVAAFEEFVRSDLRHRSAAFERELEQLTETLPDVATLRAALEGNLRDAPENIATTAELAVAVIEAQVERARAVASGEKTIVGSAAVVELDVIEEYVAAQTLAAQRQAGLRDETKQKEVLSRLAELKARQSLQAALPQVRKRLTGLKAAAALEGAADKLGTQKVSVQLRQLQEATVTAQLRTAIKDELNELTPVGSKVKLVGQASKGETVIQVKLADPCQAKVERVLSTGEQAAVATAFFLAELAVSEDRSCVVLDDPVSSLDHDHREYLAQRLVTEAGKRQVVIYTHDLTFLYYLQEAAEDGGVALEGQTLERTDTRVGVVREELPTKTVSPSHRRKTLRHRLRFELRKLHEAQAPTYEAEADKWIVDLRKGYDQLIEDYLLAGVVRRNSQRVRVRQLFKVKWTPELAQRIEKAIKKTSPKAHHESLELYSKTPTPDDLEALLDEFDSICDETAPKTEKLEDEPVIAETLVAQVQAAAKP